MAMHTRRSRRVASGRKGAESDERRRDETRRDDEGRRGSRTAALNAVPSDRQHRLLRGSWARSSFRLRFEPLNLELVRASASPRLASLFLFFFLTHTLSFISPLSYSPPPGFLSLLRCIGVLYSGVAAAAAIRPTTKEKYNLVVAGGKRVRRGAARHRHLACIRRPRVCCRAYSVRVRVCERAPGAPARSLVRSFRFVSSLPRSRACCIAVPPKRGGSPLPPSWMRGSLLGACVSVCAVSQSIFFLPLTLCMYICMHLSIYLSVTARCLLASPLIYTCISLLVCLALPLCYARSVLSLSLSLYVSSVLLRPYVDLAIERRPMQRGVGQTFFVFFLFSHQDIALSRDMSRRVALLFSAYAKGALRVLRTRRRRSMAA